MIVSWKYALTDGCALTVVLHSWKRVKKKYRLDDSRPTILTDGQAWSLLIHLLKCLELWCAFWSTVSRVYGTRFKIKTSPSVATMPLLAFFHQISFGLAEDVSSLSLSDASHECVLECLIPAPGLEKIDFFFWNRNKYYPFFEVWYREFYVWTFSFLLWIYILTSENNFEI